MGKRILIIDGHPDGRAERFIHALATAYGDAARGAGHEVKVVRIADLEFPLLHRAEDFQSRAALPEVLRFCQEFISWADHLVIAFPLWLGTLPAALKALLEQVLRPGFAFADATQPHELPRKLLSGKSVRIIVTMGMPALVFRWYFGGHGLKSLQRGILGFCGFKPVRSTLIGGVESIGAQRRAAWLERIRELGKRGL